MEINGTYLAPMAGVTDLAFRKICRSFGADKTVTEMISAKALVYGDRKTKELLSNYGECGTRGVQLFGSDSEFVAKAAVAVQNDFDFIDINMGCPAPKITGNGEGSALLKNIPLAGEIIKAAVSVCSKPVTVKIRLGYDINDDVSLAMAETAEKNGASAIAVHGRYAKEMYSGKSRNEAIAAIKKAVGIPVIGNGDVFSAEDWARMIKETGCDAVMIGRGAMGNPFLFRDIAEYKKYGYIKTKTTVAERAETARKNIMLMSEQKGEYITVLQSRKVLSWYAKGLRGAAEVKRRANAACSLDEINSIIDDMIKYYN